MPEFQGNYILGMRDDLVTDINRDTQFNEMNAEIQDSEEAVSDEGGVGAHKSLGLFIVANATV